MIESNHLQNEYIKLYSILRDYTWPMYIVELIASIEVETFKAFPDSNRLVTLLGQLRSAINRSIPEEEDQSYVDKKIESMIEYIESGQYCCKIKIDEVII